MQISIVLSFRNEAENLPELLRRLRAAMSRYSYELIFVNDDSTDGSLAFLQRELDQKRDLVVVNMSRRFGVSECVLAGMEVAQGDAVVYMDADLQDPPELIPTLIETWQRDGVDVVYTTRTKRLGESRMKLALTAVGYWILRKFSQVEIPTNSGDFKLLSRRAVTEILKLKETKPFLRGLVSWVGFRQSQVFYERESRFQGKTHFPVLGLKVIQNFLDSALISFSDAPLKLALLVGGAFLLLAMGLFVWIVIQKIIGWAVPGWSAIMTTVLFVGGTQILMLGIMGLYLNAIFLEVKGRPRYIVKEILRSH